MPGEYVYDEAASAASHMDVVHEVPDDPPSAAQWAMAMRRLNAIDDPLARKLIDLHRSCGSGTGVSDGLGDDPTLSVGARWRWGCDTLEVIADHHQVSPT